jgi:hypothetical protein
VKLEYGSLQPMALCLEELEDAIDFVQQPEISEQYKLEMDDGGCVHDCGESASQSP